MRVRTSVILVVLMTAACGKPAAPPGAPPPPAGTTTTDRAVDAGPKAVAAQPRLAAAFDVELELPGPAVSPAIQRDEEACRAAGAATCQVLGSERAEGDGGAAHAVLKLRAEPQWLVRFRDGLSAKARAAGGRMSGAKATSEDLTHTIVDGQATLEAKRLLAERLKGLLATRQGKLSDLLEVENALAESQGQIDGARSELAILRDRVAAAVMTITYETLPAPGSQSPWRPVGVALRGAERGFAASLAVLVTAGATLLPVILAVAAFGWALWALTRRRTAPGRPE